MTFMQGPGLLLLAPLIVCFFIGVSAALDSVILACLAKRPADRPFTVSELAKRLRACPVREPWTEARAQDWWDRHLPAREDGQRAGPSNFRVDFTPDRTR